MMPNKIRTGVASFDDVPTLTIIIVTFNAAAYIEECLNSVLSHVTLPHQIIIMDGASTDGTINLLKKFEKHIDILISEKDQGIYDAMNKSLPYIRGKWVLFLGADDRILPSIKHMEKCLLDENTIYYGNCQNDANLAGQQFSAYKLAKMNLCHQGIFYPRNIFRKYSYSLKYQVYADHVLNMQCWGDADFKKEYKNIDIAYFNLQGFSSFAEDQAFKQDKPLLIRKYLGLLVYCRYLLKKFRESNKPGSEFF